MHLVNGGTVADRFGNTFGHRIDPPLAKTCVQHIKAKNVVAVNPSHTHIVCYQDNAERLGFVFASEFVSKVCLSANLVVKTEFVFS